MVDAHHCSHAGRLEMRWLPVQTSSGRARMEAVWIVTDTSGASTDSTAPTAA